MLISCFDLIVLLGPVQCLNCGDCVRVADELCSWLRQATIYMLRKNLSSALQVRINPRAWFVLRVWCNCSLTWEIVLVVISHSFFAVEQTLEHAYAVIMESDTLGILAQQVIGCLTPVLRTDNQFARGFAPIAPCLLALHTLEHRSHVF